MATLLHDYLLEHHMEHLDLQDMAALACTDKG